MGNDELGDRMKMYERIEGGRLMPLVPAVARLDGKCFHGLTKNMERPFDAKFTSAMIGLCAYLVEETQPLIGYTQSDEITLIWHSDCLKSQIFFDGKTHKMVSILAAMASVHFSDTIGREALFDCRVWSVPSKTEACNVLVWREIDATKNSVAMAARSVYSHKELYGKGRADMMDMLMEKGVNWNDYPPEHKRGTYFQRRTVKRKLSPGDIESLPPLHNARKNPDMEFERQETRRLDMPPFLKVSNREAVVFEGADPVRFSEKIDDVE